MVALPAYMAVDLAEALFGAGLNQKDGITYVVIEYQYTNLVARESTVTGK